MILTGAGSSIVIKEDKKIGPDRDELWAACSKAISEARMNELSRKIQYDVEKKDIEALLSQAYMANYVIKQNKQCKKNCENCKKVKHIASCIEKIENAIKEKCTLELTPDVPHKEFLKKITSRKIGAPRVKIFTLNYEPRLNKRQKISLSSMAFLIHRSEFLMVNIMTMIL